MAEDGKDSEVKLRYSKVRPTVKSSIQKSLQSGAKPKEIRSLRKAAFFAAEEKQEELEEQRTKTEEEKAKLEEEKAELAKLATTDSLTGLLNRRGYKDREEQEVARAIRNNHPLVVASLDLNDLKTTNDTLGYQKGDEVLITAAEAIREITRLEDPAARIGGDEFRVLLVETDLDEAKVWRERLRKKCKGKKVNISIGLSPVDLTADIQRSINIADARMRQDKTTQKTENGK